MSLYTAQFRYPKADRIDVTVKSASTEIGKILAPTWNIVMALKNNQITEAQYAERYLSLLWQARNNHGHLFELLAVWCSASDIVLVCYCNTYAFCHRKLAAQYMKDEYGTDYVGEITDTKTWNKKEVIT